MNQINVFRTIGCVILLLLAVYFIPEYKEFADFGNVEGMFVYGILLGVVYFLFGILLELGRLIELIKERTYKIYWGKLITMSILILLISIPISNWILWFGLSFPYPYIPFIYPEIKAVLTVVSGILLVRSFEKSSD